MSRDFDSHHSRGRSTAGDALRKTGVGKLMPAGPESRKPKKSKDRPQYYDEDDASKDATYAPTSDTDKPPGSDEADDGKGTDADRDGGEGGILTGYFSSLQDSGTSEEEDYDEYGKKKRRGKGKSGQPDSDEDDDKGKKKRGKGWGIIPGFPGGKEGDEDYYDDDGDTDGKKKKKKKKGKGRKRGYDDYDEIDESGKGKHKWRGKGRGKGKKDADADVKKEIWWCKRTEEDPITADQIKRKKWKCLKATFRPLRHIMAVSCFICLTVVHVPMTTYPNHINEYFQRVDTIPEIEILLLNFSYIKSAFATSTLKLWHPYNTPNRQGSFCKKFAKHPLIDAVKAGNYPKWGSTPYGELVIAFYRGLTAAAFPAGVFANYISAKFTMIVAMIIAMVGTIQLTPAIGNIDLEAMVSSRFLQGIGCGACYPCVTKIVGNWSPKREECLLSGIAFAGIPFGVAFGYLISCPSSYYKSVHNSLVSFYVVAILVCLIVLADNSIVHVLGSNKETRYIMAQWTHDRHFKWYERCFRIIPDVCLLGLSLTQMFHSAGWYFAIIELPYFLPDLYEYYMCANCGTIAIVFIATAISSIGAGVLLDFCKARRIIREPFQARKIAVTASGCASAVLLLTATFSICNYNFVLLCIFLSTIIQGAAYPAFFTSHADYSVKDGALLMGFTTAVAGLMSIIVPLYTGRRLVKDAFSKDVFSDVLTVLSFAYILEVLFYALLSRWSLYDQIIKRRR